MRCLVLLTLVVLSGACGPLVGAGHGEVARTSGRLTIGDEVVDLTVTGCATIGGRLAANLPVEGSETTLTATGRTDADRPVEVVVRRTRSGQAPHVVQSVEIGIGDPRRRIEALVLYRAFDEDTERWTSIDPDAPSSRAEAAGPLLILLDDGLRANGVARRADTGSPVAVRLDADCPIELDDGPGLAHPDLRSGDGTDVGQGLLPG